MPYGPRIVRYGYGYGGPHRSANRVWIVSSHDARTQPYSSYYSRVSVVRSILVMVMPVINHLTLYHDDDNNKQSPLLHGVMLLYGFLLVGSVDPAEMKRDQNKLHHACAR
jgi:hypothetical protein